MQEDKGIMKVETVLPEDFDGVFRFTNWTEEEFVAKWGGKEYRFPALTTSPIIIPEHSPLEIQNIRKKFAKDLAEKEFFRSTSYNKYYNQERNSDGTPKLNSIHQAGQYSLTDLTPFIQKCLEPLQVGKASVNEAEKPIDVEGSLTRNEEGEPNTQAIDRKTSLKEKALKA